MAKPERSFDRCGSGITSVILRASQQIESVATDSCLADRIAELGDAKIRKMETDRHRAFCPDAARREET